ncbi:type I polyketide synthase [Streptomyces longispororuber]|uniref:Type I polyketide synthase n=2 Tax=Streptomyces longispororuber TaxID=68230 RepID=A0A918ZBX8_9ACTN|nr:type I polyketide synthase [Streptomyces longispororuber]
MDVTGRAVAVVGVGCRLPGGLMNLTDLWEALSQGRDLVGRMPEDRFDRALRVDPGPQRPFRSYTAAGGFLTDVAEFDAGYFGIAPVEAASMDPQQRLALELVVEALDDAGIPAESLAGTPSPVFIGVSDMSYARLQSRLREGQTPYGMSGGALSIVANRLSYFLDLRGPSMVIDTACSSSLVALDRACRALLEGPGRVAVAGGVNILSGPEGFVGFSAASMLSRRGRCAAFSAEADGFVRAEGGGVVVLKRLADAVADGDRVHAVIAGTGVNSDGRTMGLALPSSAAQEALLREVYEGTYVRPDDLVYFEAHGTGTTVGDPAEAQAVGRALGRRRAAGRLPIGSVKSNLGHLEPASGMAGLFKALLVLRHGTAPATLHAQPLNPGIDFAELGLAPTVEPVAVGLHPRAAVGVNSFGFGGVNAHVVLTAPPASPPAVPASPGLLPVTVSARSATALKELAARVSTRLRQAAPEEFYDLAHTSTRRRSTHAHRATVLAGSGRQAAEELESLFDGRPAAGAVRPPTDRGAVAFAFCGNASQWPGMAADLLAHDPVFRAAVEEADAALTAHLGWSVARELARPAPDRWHRTEVAQPLLFAVQLGLSAHLAARGVRPAAVFGHSVGEIAAAHVAGALTLDQAAQVIAARGRAQAATAGSGRMAAVGLPEDQAREALAPYGDALEIAGINSDRDVTVAGDPEALTALGTALAARDVFFRELDLDYAFHSRAMECAAGPLRDALADLRPSVARVPFVSTVTGTSLPGEELTARYWWRNVREPVRFAEAAAHALDDRVGVVVEIGPHPVLRPYLRRTGAVHVPTLHRDAPGPQAVAVSVAALIAAGAEVDWRAHFPSPARVADLPSYPWQRRRHWHGGPTDWERSSGTGHFEHPLLGERLPGPLPLWEATVEPQLVPWLGDHLVDDAVVVPAAAYAEMVLAAGRRAVRAPVEVRHLRITRPLSLSWPDPGDRRLQTAVQPDSGTVTVGAGEGRGAESRPVATAQVHTLIGRSPTAVDTEAARARSSHHLDATRYYDACRRLGLAYGPAFRLLHDLWTGDGEVLASYGYDGPDQTWEIFPPVLDAAFQAGAPLLLAERADNHAYLPTGLRALRVWRPPGPSGFVHVRARTAVEPEACWDITITDQDGTVAVEIDRLCLRRMPSGRTPLSVQRTVLRAAPRPETTGAAPHLPSSAALLASAADRIAELDRTWRDSGLHQVTHAARDFIARCWPAVLADFLPEPTAPFTVKDLLDAGLLPQHRRLLKAVLPDLQRHGVTRLRPDGRWQLTGEPRRDGEPLRALLAENPAGGPEVGLAARHVQHLPGLLRGTVDPIQLLTSDTVRYQQFFDLGPRNRFTNLLTRAVMEEIVRCWPEDRPLRVLEIGAGTGGLTAAVLSALPAERTRYTFTDVSATLLSPAEHRFAAYDFVDYRTFDLNAEPDDQQLPEGGFDVVLAANALHTAADLVTALRRVSRLLAPGGRLLAVESHDTVQLCGFFGALDSFWRRSDQTLRPDSLLLSHEQWPPLLEKCGFTDVVRTGTGTGPDPTQFSLYVATAQDRVVAPPVPADPPAGTTWAIGVESPAEEPLARALAALLGNATVTSLDDVSAPVAEGAQEAVAVLLLAEPEDEPASVVTRTTRRIAAFKALASARDRLPDSVRTRTWLVTRPSGVLPAPERPAHPGDAPIWGAARTLANERPELVVHRVSLDRGDDPADDARRLARELLAPSAEDEVVLTRGGGRFVPRETERPAHHAPATAPAGRYTLAVRDPGLSYRLVWQECPAADPGSGRITVAVKAAGLNYRDTLQVNGLLPSEAVEGTATAQDLGMECAGVVTAVGPDVTAWTPGDRVFGLAPSALASHVVVDAQAVGRIPDGMSFAEAATLPVVFATVHHSLARLARLAPGETVLVHGGAGGIGLAVLQYARLIGAKVIATAGSDTKRDLLTALGADHVLDSRTLEFAARVRELTGGRGVDVVVNSLNGQAIARSLELLRPGGRFIELGKRDMLEDKPLPARPFLHNLTYFGVDLNGLLSEPAAAAELFADVTDGIRTGAYRPLPHVVYPAARVHEAFRLLQHSRHTGKVIVSFAPVDEPVPVQPAPVAPRALDPAGTYLVTGGLGGFGAATADWLVGHGARHLALVSRQGAHAPEADTVLERLTRRGVTATPYAADVTDETAMRHVLSAVAATGHPLRGVVHCAMQLDDAPLTDLTDERFAAVLAPKAAGAAVLHRLTAGHDLDVFLLWSSMAACLGNMHQAPYVAGNNYLEALARARRRTGLPGTTLSWGAVSRTGYVDRNNLHTALHSLGIEPVDAEALLAAADDVLADGADVAGVSKMGWARARRVLPALAAPRFLQVIPAHAAATDDSREELLRSLASMTPEDAVQAITTALAGLLATVMHTDPAELPADRPLSEFGLDSLMGAELLVRTREYFDIRLSPSELQAEEGSLTRIARLIHQRLHTQHAGPGTGVPAAPAAASA